METIIELKQHIKKLCQQPTNLFAPDFFTLHIEMVEKYALQLADVVGADKEIVQFAAIMHDIAAIVDFSNLAKHAETGAPMALNLLANFPLNKIQKDNIAQCIINHSHPIKIGDNTLEAVCLSNADAMSQIAQPFYWSFYIFNVRKFNFDEGYKWYLQRVNSNWDALIEPARNIIQEQYLFVQKLFS